eukprot:gene20552-biopygen23574
MWSGKCCGTPALRVGPPPRSARSAGGSGGGSGSECRCGGYTVPGLKEQVRGKRSAGPKRDCTAQTFNTGNVVWGSIMPFLWVEWSGVRRGF